MTIPRNKRVSITINEKISCGINTLNILLQSPDNNDGLGLWWSYDVPFSSDCIDYSIEEEREKTGVKKAPISTSFVNITRVAVRDYSSKVASYFDYDRLVDEKDVTWFTFPKGSDTESNVALVRTQLS